MPTPSTRMGLSLPTQADRFSTADLRSNWEKLDAAPGLHICTSSTRPTWTSAYAGRKILETNTGLEWLWTGTVWTRASGGSGVLRRTNGTKAYGERTTPWSTTSTDWKRIVPLTSVVVPAGNRTLMLVATWYQADNNTGLAAAAIFRSNADNSGPQLYATVIAQNANEAGNGGQLIAMERDGLAAGTYDFSLQAKAIGGGSAYFFGNTIAPITLTVIEL